MKLFTLAGAAACLAITATPAMAGSNERPVEKVSVSGIDLDTPAGQRILDQRIDRAAKSVCRVDEIRTGTRLKRSDAKACYNKARASAKRQVATIVEAQRLGG